MGGVDEALRQRLLRAFRWVDLGAGTTHEISDISGWWRDAGLLRDLGPALAAPFADEAPTVVVGPETSGFLLGPLVAHALGAGFVEVYKDGARGTIADRTLSRATPTDYRGRAVTLTIRARLLTADDRVLVVDDWAATGAQLIAVRSLVLDAGARYLGCSVIVDACPATVAATLRLRGLLHRADLDGPLWRS